MIASLRARLIATLIALAAGGLLLLGGITYAEQRSFLLTRLDQQVRGAGEAIGHSLGDGDEPAPPLGAPTGGRRPRRPGGPERGRPPELRFPPGTYGVRRTAAGNVVGTPVVVDFGQTVTTRPALPARLPTGRVLTVDGRGDGAPRYRVLATPVRGSTEVTVVAVPLREVDQTLHRLLLVEALVLLGVLLVLGLAAAVLVRIGLRPLDRMGVTAGAIAGGDLSHRVADTDPRTEVGRLGRSLNAMLDRLEQAFSQRAASERRLRQFIADASHELRTPLASIRGYAELLRIGAAERPEDAARSLRRIEEEAARMGVLVEDLLTLARLDAMPDAAREPVELAALARDAVDDARAAAPERKITLHAGPAPATVSGDAAQVRQVLANLLRNALVHTPGGTPIEVTVEDDGGGGGGRVSVAVRDHGPGLPTARPSALFERFWRAEGGRARGRAGAGLGLAIVAGIVDAHGGSVEAENAAGGGALFTVRLPRR